MHVVIVSQYWHPENGVPQRRWAWLTQHLTQAGHNVTVITPPPNYDRAEKRAQRSQSKPETGPHGETILRCSFLPTGNSLISRALGQASIAGFMLSRALGPNGLRTTNNNQPVDLVIGTVPAIPTAFVTQAIAKALRVPYVIDLRDAWPDLLQQARRWNEATGTTSWRERLLNSGPMYVIERAVRVAMYSTLRNAHAVMVTSEWLGQSLANNPHLQHGTNAGADKYILVRNLFPASVPAQPRTPTTTNAERPLRVLYAGTVGRAQQLTNIIDALSISEYSATPITFRVVGEGAALEYLKTYAAAKLEQATHVSVEFIARVPAAEMHTHYEWADTALVHLTDWEPLKRAVPSKTYELLELGVPISAAIAGETATLIEESGAGFVVQPLDPEALAEAWASNIDDLRNRTWNNSSTTNHTKQWLAEQRESTIERFLNMVQQLS